jgi:orotate phosphoribosyltransferase
MRRTLVVVDDIVTTGATLAAVATRLGEANMQVTGAAVLAATELRRSRPGGPAGPPPPGPTGVERRRRVPLNEG